MECAHYRRRECRSCTLLPTPYADQVAAKEARCRELLGAWPELAWEDPATGPEAGFRNKAKMAVGGTAEAPTLGILDAGHRGVDLRDCPIQADPLAAAMPRLARFVTEAAVEPYDVGSRRGELKHLLVTASPDGELMVRFVLRSLEAESRIRKHLPALRRDLPQLRVVSLNLQPDHKAVLEGERELVLTPEDTLAMPLDLGSEGPGGSDPLTLHLRPQSFFQTNTAIAEELYRTATRWSAELGPLPRVLDLYCGVGGFALALAAPGRDVVGVELSEEAVRSARRSAEQAGSQGGARFVAGDATAYALGQEDTPDLVVVNPPRRGIGAELSGWLERSDVPYLLYSSCNPETLANDLRAMPSLRPVRARVLDMFPHTDHLEVLVLAAR